MITIINICPRPFALHHYLNPLALLFICCLAIPLNAVAELDYQKKADELLPVDCLLPGTVRKLGGQLTYLTPRRPIKTTAADCEIRGGEYVLYDRASYESALNVWAPLANQGDARAQNFVGEIYEKGLGVDPDYQTAASWYLKAAEQDYSAAEINIGQLYERGLGVPRDMEKALSWYRKAANIKGKILKFVSFDYSDEKIAAMEEEISSGKQLASTQQQEIKTLALKLERANNEKTNTQKRLSDQQETLTAEREIFERQKLDLAEHKRDTENLRSQLDKQLTAMKAAQQTNNKSIDEATLRDRKKIAQLESALKQHQLKSEQLSEQLARNKTLIDSQEKALLEKTNDESRQTKNAELLVIRKQTDTLRKELALQRSAKQTAEESLAQIKALYRSEKSREKTFKAPAFVIQFDKAKIASLKKELKKSELKTKIFNEQLANSKAQLSSREEALKEKNKELTQLTNKYKTIQEQLLTQKSILPTATKPISKVATSRVAPVIEMIEPPLLATRGNTVIKTRAGIDQRTIIGQVSSSNKLMEVLVNDKETTLDDKGFFQHRVNLIDSETPVTIVAVDKLGLRSNLNFLLKQEYPEEKNLFSNQKPIEKNASFKKIPRLNYGKYFALVIGNSDYKPPLPDLNTTVEDARAVSSILKNRYGFEVTTLTNATRYNILSALNTLREKLTEDDNLLIYYAGHGELDKVNNRGHWLPIDAEQTSTANWISNIAITDLLNSMSAKKVLVIADSCYSGAMTRSTLARLDAGRSESARVSWLKLVAEKRSRLSFSSGGLAPVLDGGGGKHSVFAKALLDALDRNNNVIEGRQLHSQVAQAVSYAAAAAQFEQTPQYAPIRYAGHESGDFLFVPKTL